MANVNKEVLDQQPAAILGRAIQKAVDSGYDQSLGQSMLDLLPQIFAADEATRMQMLRGFIFNHDFAKALWGNKFVYIIGGSEPGERAALLYPTLPRYKYHLQQMVAADDPIKYLGENT